MNRKHFAPVLPLVATLAFVAACGSSASDKPSASGGTSPLRIAISATAGSLPVFVADEKGYFADHHLKVTMTPVADATTTPNALGRQFDIGFTVQPITINAAVGGVPIKVVGGGQLDSASNPGAVILTKKGSPITKIADLKGKTVATATLFGANTMLTKSMLDSAGVDPKTVRFVQVPFPNMPDQLNSGRVDAVITTNPYSTQLTDEGAQKLGEPYRVLGTDVLSTMWIANSDWAAKHKDELGDFTAALGDAIKFIQDDTAGARKILEEKTQLPASVIEAAPIPAFQKEFGSDDIAPWISLMQKYGTIKPEVKAEDLTSRLLGGSS